MCSFLFLCSYSSSNSSSSSISCCCNCCVYCCCRCCCRHRRRSGLSVLVLNSTIAYSCNHLRLVSSSILVISLRRILNCGVVIIVTPIVVRIVTSEVVIVVTSVVTVIITGINTHLKEWHYSDVIVKWRLKSPASRLFPEPFVQA